MTAQLKSIFDSGNGYQNLSVVERRNTDRS